MFPSESSSFSKSTPTNSKPSFSTSPLLLPSPTTTASSCSSTPSSTQDDLILPPSFSSFTTSTSKDPSTIPSLFNALNLHQRVQVLQDLLPLLNENEVQLAYQLTLKHPKLKRILLMDFPNEILLWIFHYLDAKSLLQLACTNRRCYQLIKDNQLWHRILHRYPSVYAVAKLSSKSKLPPSSPLFASSSYSSKLPLLLIPKYEEWFKLGYLTHLNWKHGRCKISHVQRRPQGSLHTDFDLNSNLVASISMRESSLWDYTTGQINMHYSGTDTTLMTTLKFSPLHVLIGFSDGTLRVWRKLDHVLVQTIQVHPHEIGVIESDDTMIASGCEDSTIATWNMQTGQLVAQFLGHTAGICSLQFSQQENILVSGAADYTIRVWSLQGTCLKVLQGHTAEIFSLALSGQYIVSGSGDHKIKLWSRQTYELVRTLEEHKAAVVCLQLDRHKLISGSVDKTIKVWSLTSSRSLYTLCDQHLSGVHQLKFNETTLMSSDLNCGLIIYDFTHSENDPH